MSIASPGVYSLPMLLLVGWRGEPGKRDEPQHRIQGPATPGILGKKILLLFLRYLKIAYILSCSWYSFSTIT